MKKALINTARLGGHIAMAPLEAMLARQAERIASPPIFIIGAPRSGTSLLYELMITRFRFAYISNAAHRFYKTPLAASRVFRSAIEGWQGDFTSRYGHIDGWGAPNEGGWIWQRWLADGDAVEHADIAASKISELRTLTAGLSNVMDAPFLNKNVMHSNRLLLMHHIWPDALYIEVRRDILDNVRSIVRAERAEGGPGKHADQWWSVRPRTASDYAGQSDCARAVAQVVGVTRDIAADLHANVANRLLTVNYADICSATQTTLKAIEKFLVTKRSRLAKRLDVPKCFPVRPSSPLSEKDESIIAHTLSQFRVRP